MKQTIDERLVAIIKELQDNGITLAQATSAFEEKYIDAALSRTSRHTTRRRGLQPNVTQASKALGVHRNTLHNKLRGRLGLMIRERISVERKGSRA
jgi:transcriptional regulator of acetoin/glycerol metabolism